jgi:hypothetical protein
MISEIGRPVPPQAQTGTDGEVHGEKSSSDPILADASSFGGFRLVTGKATTDQAVMIGDDPLSLTVKSLGRVQVGAPENPPARSHRQLIESASLRVRLSGWSEGAPCENLRH